MSGVVTITVTVTDNGGTANGGVNTVQQTFTVTVPPVNQQPTFTVTPPRRSTRIPASRQSRDRHLGRPGDTATASATITAGQVSAITVTDGGNGYTSACPRSRSPRGGGGSGARRPPS